MCVLDNSVCAHAHLCAWVCAYLCVDVCVFRGQPQLSGCWMLCLLSLLSGVLYMCQTVLEALCCCSVTKSYPIVLWSQWIVAHQAPLSLGFSRQEHWSGLPFPSPVYESEKWKCSCSVVSDSLRPHALQPTSLLHPRDFPAKSTGVGCHHLLQLV